LDEEFQGPGTALSGGLAGVIQVEMLSDGKILFAGAGTGPYDALARLHPDGSLDSDFMPELTLPGGSFVTSVYGFVLEASGNVVAVADGLGLFRLFSQGPAQEPTLLLPVLSGDGVRLWFSTFADRSCVVEHAEGLGSPWSGFPPIVGTGSTQSILDQTAPSPAHFYRIRVVE
jgi:hypothetical protein